MNAHKYSGLLLIVLLSACHTQKKAAPPAVVKDNEIAIALDTVNVLARAPAVKQIYRESNPRMNDIIHTKLEVEFDWTRCRMNGKATLQLKPYFYPVKMLYLNARGM